MSPKKGWSHHAAFLIGPDAEHLYRRMMRLPWPQPDGNEATSACHFGSSYSQVADGARGEITAIPDFLKALADKIAMHVSMPVNYVQCHRMTADGFVRPHFDPSGMIVPMLTLGQARTFRVGGTFPYGGSQSQRPVECHKPAEQILMRHGDLLVFNGGRTAHSMFPAIQDLESVVGGYDFRISILFRWTTSIMRAMGPNRTKWSLPQVQRHESEYAAARKNFLGEHPMQPSLF